MSHNFYCYKVKIMLFFIHKEQIGQGCPVCSLVPEDYFTTNLRPFLM